MHYPAGGAVAPAITYPGVALSMALTTDMVVSAVPPEKAGGAPGLATTANDLGISLGVAVIGSIGLAVYRSRIEATLREGLSPEVADQFCERLVAVAQDACTGGLNTAASVSPAVAALAVVIAVTGLRHLRPTGQPPASPPGPVALGTPPHVDPYPLWV